MFHVLQTKRLGLDQSQNTTWGTNNNVGTVLLQHLLIFLDWHATKENSNLDIVHVLAESFIVLTDLESQLSGVCKDQHRNLKKKSMYNYTQPTTKQTTSWNRTTNKRNIIRQRIISRFEKIHLLSIFTLNLYHNLNLCKVCVPFHLQAQAVEGWPRQTQLFCPYQILPDITHP